MEYVRNYEDDLVKYYPTKSNVISPDEPDYTSNNEELACRYLNDIKIKFPETNPINPDPASRRLLDYLQGRRLGAMTDLRKNHGEFLSTGSAADAKMGLVNAYVAITAMPSPNEIKNIVDMVEPLLTELTKE